MFAGWRRTAAAPLCRNVGALLVICHWHRHELIDWWTAVVRGVALRKAALCTQHAAARPKLKKGQEPPSAL